MDVASWRYNWVGLDVYNKNMSVYSVHRHDICQKHYATGILKAKNLGKNAKIATKANLQQKSANALKSPLCNKIYATNNDTFCVKVA